MAGPACCAAGRFRTRRREPLARREWGSLRSLPNSEKSASRAPAPRNRPRRPLGRFGRTPVRPRCRSRLRRPFRRRLGIETRRGWGEGHRRSVRRGRRRPITIRSTITITSGNREHGTGNTELGARNTEHGTRSPEPGTLDTRHPPPAHARRTPTCSEDLRHRRTADQGLTNVLDAKCEGWATIQMRSETHAAPGRRVTGPSRGRQSRSRPAGSARAGPSAAAEEDEGKPVRRPRITRIAPHFLSPTGRADRMPCVRSCRQSART